MMKTKTILFRYRSASGPFACSDGEIESTVNARLVPTSSSYVADDDAIISTPSGYDPATASAPLTPELFSRLSTPLPCVEFAITPTPLAWWQNHPDNPPAISVDAPKSKDMDGWTLRAAETLAKFHTDALRQHLFTEPFLALVALRLKNGSHILPSSPVLLLPNTSAPAVDGSDNLSLDTMTMTIRNAVCHRLSARITLPAALAETSSTAISEGKSTASSARISESLSDYTDIIEAIDIFVSAPIPLYDHDAPLSPTHRAAGSSSPQSWLPQVFNDNEFSARLLSTATFRAISSVPLSAEGDHHGADTTGYASDFSGNWADVDFNIPDFSSIPALAKDNRVKDFLSYTPDYLPHHAISASTSCTYSGQTILTDLTLSLPLPPPLSTLIPSDIESLSTVASTVASTVVGLHRGVAATEAPATVAPETTSVALETESLKNGETLHAYAYDPAWAAVALSDASFPRWLFLPDPDIRQLSLITPEAIYTVPMRRHPFLNGSYYWCGSPEGRDLSLTGVRKTAANVTLPTEKTLRRDSWKQPGTIRMSDSSIALSPAELSRLSRAPVMVTPVDPSLPIEIVTRPLKLSSLFPDSTAISNTVNAPFKTSGASDSKSRDSGVFNSLSKIWANRLEIRLAGAFTGTPRITLYGSDNLVDWHPHPVATVPTLSGAIALVSPSSARRAHPYARLAISGKISGSLEAILLTLPS